MEKIKVLHRRKRHSKQSINELRKFLTILYNYDIDVRGYMYDETVQELKEKNYNLTCFIEDIIKTLKIESEENFEIDDELVAFNNSYIEKLSSLNFELLQAWQDNLPNIVNVEYDTLFIKYTLRGVKQKND